VADTWAKCSKPAWLSITPLGCPVVPEVKMIAATVGPKGPSCTVANWKTGLRSKPGKTLGMVL
jgi:hypothetical protein